MNKKYTNDEIALYVRQWIRNSFMDLLNINTIANDNVKNSVIKIDTYKSHIRRFESLNMIYNHYVVKNITAMICTLVTIVKGDKSVNIGYIYSRYDVSTSNALIYSICTGVNMTSVDGEYRGRFINAESIDIIHQLYPSIVDTIERHIYSKKYDIVVTNFHTYEKINNIDDVANITTMQCILITWFCEMYLIYFKLQNNHKNPDFNHVMFDGTDMVVFKHIYDTYGEVCIYDIYHICTTYTRVLIVDANNKTNTGVIKNIKSDSATITHKMGQRAECGQKLIPLKLSEVLNVMNPAYKVWKEVIIWKLASNLVMNLITPGVSVFHTWFIINNGKDALFNNRTMVDRYKINTVTHRNNISNAIMAIVCESTGSTINNTLLHHTSHHYKNKNMDLFSHPAYFMKYLFEITYTLYCLNTVCDVIHTDLHLNNTTMNSIYYPWVDYGRATLNVKPDSKDKVMYHIGGNTYYMFQHIIKYATIIDYSRSIVKYKRVDKCIKTHADKSKFKNKQVDVICDWYSVHMAEMYNIYKGDIRKLCTDRYDTVFMLFSAVDIYQHTVLMLRFLGNINCVINVDISMSDTLKKMISMSRGYLESGMKSLIDNNNWVPSMWPNLDIIKSCFKDYLVDVNNIGDVTIVDFFNYDNQYKYDKYDIYKVPPRFGELHYSTKKWGEPGYNTTHMHKFTTIYPYTSVNPINTKLKIKNEYDKSITDWTNANPTGK